MFLPQWSIAGLTITRREFKRSIAKHRYQNVIGVTENLTIIRDLLHQAAIDAGRDPESITLVAVSKKHPVTAVLEAAAAGQRDFGENFVQEGVDKIRHAGRDDLVWHYIGHLQSNKTRDAAKYFDWVHTIDRMKIARRLSAQRPDELPPLNVCIQVNIDDETSKSGVPPAAAVGIAEEVARLDRLRLRGFMCIPEPTADVGEQRRAFRTLSDIARTARERGMDVDTLSMGMSSDYAAAIAEGATLVRIGTAIFGPRPE
jgi:pyridoxal phosphate enzyme (YggS family)